MTIDTDTKADHTDENDRDRVLPVTFARVPVGGVRSSVVNFRVVVIVIERRTARLRDSAVVDHSCNCSRFGRLSAIN
jgi:hypothetical protein